MNRLLWTLDKILGRRLSKQTRRHLAEVAHAATRSSHSRASALLRQMSAEAGPHVVLGETLWRQSVNLPVDALVKAHSIITGGSGSGKTMTMLTILDAMLAAIVDAIRAGRSTEIPFGVGLLDPKTEAFTRAIYLIGRRLAKLPPEQAEQLRQRIVIIDLAAGDPLTSYNIARPWTGSDLDFFATSRVETMGEVLAPSEGLSLRGGLIVKFALKLLAECDLPFSCIERVLSEDALRTALIARARSEDVRYFFRQHFPKESKSTLAAVQARLSSALLSTESLRLALSGNTLPDFRRFQDEGKIVLINCGGSNIARPTARILQSLFLSDIRQSIFARNTQTPYLWICDEAQAFLSSKRLRENIDELLRLARSFGSFFCLLTQNLSTAVQDGDLLETIHTNIRWSFSMRSMPRDAAFLQPALPINGRLQKPRFNPYAPPEFYSLNEERVVRLSGLTHLPDRTGWLWLKAWTGEAIKLKTATLEIPSGARFNSAVERLRADPSFGERSGRVAYLEAIEKRDAVWRENANSSPDKLEELKRRYQS
jgi:hypothetical protein